MGFRVWFTSGESWCPLIQYQVVLIINARRAVDGLINYETVKYFNNDDHEINRYRDTMEEWEEAAVKSQNTMSILNFGQAAIIAIGVTGIMILAAQGVVDQQLTLGDLVLINTMMLQLFLPLSFLG